MKLIIAGGRKFDNYTLLKSEVNKFIQFHNDTNITVISGGATGADNLGERYARENNLILSRKNADWNKYGRAAGPIRNEEMAKEGTHLIAFWNGSKVRSGTYNMICIAQKYNLIYRVITTATTQSSLF